MAPARYSKQGTDRISGHHPFSQLTKDFTPETRQRIDAIKRELLAETPFREPHQVKELTQGEKPNTRCSCAREDGTDGN